MGIHVGFKENKKPKIFDSVTKPTKETYPQYDIVYGYVCMLHENRLDIRYPVLLIFFE